MQDNKQRQLDIGLIPSGRQALQGQEKEGIVNREKADG
jgi:hypothetical protein